MMNTSDQVQYQHARARLLESVRLEREEERRKTIKYKFVSTIVESGFDVTFVKEQQIRCARHQQSIAQNLEQVIQAQSDLTDAQEGKTVFTIFVDETKKIHKINYQRIN